MRMLYIREEVWHSVASEQYKFCNTVPDYLLTITLLQNIAPRKKY